MAIQLTLQLFSLTIKYLRLLEIICIRGTCLLAFQAAFRVVDRMVLPTMIHGVFGASLVFVWNGAQRKSLIFGFQEFSASNDKAFILAGEWAPGYHSVGYGHFPHIS